MGKFPEGLKYIALILCTLIISVGLIACEPKTQNPTTITPTPEAAPTPTLILTPAATPTQTPAATPSEKGSLIGFYPLKEGNMWEYEGEGMEYASFIQRVVFSSGNRHQVTVDNGGSIIANVLEERPEAIVNIYKSAEADINENMLKKPSNVNIILLQDPLEKGNFWISEENHYEIVDLEADITVPAGEFKDCIAVKTTFKDQTSNMVYYYKRGIGMVQSEFRTDSGDLITSKLKRYDLK